MATLVVTVLGDDQAGLVDALSGVITDHGGNWDRSHMASLAGKFAGIVVVTVPDRNADALIAGLGPLESQGLLDVTVATATRGGSAAPARIISLELVGQDHPGIVHDISHALAGHQVSIEELETSIESAPMTAERLFKARATLRVPSGVSLDALRDALEAVASELMVDIDLTTDADA